MPASPPDKISKLSFRCTCGRVLEFLPLNYVGEHRSVACWGCKRAHGFHRATRGWVKQIGTLRPSAGPLIQRFASRLRKQPDVANFVFQYYVGEDRAILVDLAYQRATGAACVRGGNLAEFATTVDTPEDAQDQWARFYESEGGFHRP
jgi:hypothetical protein